MSRSLTKYCEMPQESERRREDLGIDVAEESAGIESVGKNLVRRQFELSEEEKQYLLAVERGDLPTVQQHLCKARDTYSLNINCVDPFGRTGLHIAIENDNIEMIELLLRFHVELFDGLLHAINEDNVEATRIILNYQAQNQKISSPLDIPGNKILTLYSVLNWLETRKHSEKAFKITATWRKLTLKKESSLDEGDIDLKSHSIPEKAFKITAKWRKLTLKKESSLDEGDIDLKSHEGHSSSFTPDITPLILAAHRDNYEIIKILLDRGDRILKPHDVRCGCPECVTKSSEDSLNHSRSRINSYRALASPSLMSLTSPDPILTAFQLSWELRLLSRLENEFKVEYERLSSQCQSYAVDLLDQTRGSKELETLLNYDRDYFPSSDRGDRMNLARLKMAIKYNQKKFVAHANCQQLLASLWYEGLLGFRRRHFVFQTLLTFSICFMFPVFVIVYTVAPKSSLGLFIRRPFIKFLCHSASYITFLFLLILASQRIESIINLAGSDVDETEMKMTREVRGAPPTSIEWMILAYVAGFVWAEVKQLWDQGLKAYIHDMWNILDFITNSLYIATYALKLVAYLRVEEEKRNDQWHLARASRDQWDAYDPTLISEGLFACANIFSSLKIIYIFTVNPHLGPLQISLGRMVIDIMKFLFIALLVCFSYSCGVNQLYWYYAEARQRNCTACMATKADPSICKCDRSLANLFEIIQTLYFAVYGLVEISHFELRERHEFTQFVGKLMYGTYCGIMTIVLINMFIAMLSSSFQKISDDQDTEWKFARSKLWMSYFDEGATVPAPFNIIPTPKTFYYIMRWCKYRICRCSTTAKNSRWQSIRRAVQKVKERDKQYQGVIQELVRRYVMKRQRATNMEGVSEDDVNEIKQDISSFRYELLEILRCNGMALPSTGLPTDPNNHMNNRHRKKMGRSPFSKLCSLSGSSCELYDSTDALSGNGGRNHSTDSPSHDPRSRSLTKQYSVDLPPPPSYSSNSNGSNGTPKRFPPGLPGHLPSVDESLEEYCNQKSEGPLNPRDRFRKILLKNVGALRKKEGGIPGIGVSLDSSEGPTVRSEVRNNSSTATLPNDTEPLCQSTSNHSECSAADSTQIGLYRNSVFPSSGSIDALTDSTLNDITQALSGPDPHGSIRHIDSSPAEDMFTSNVSNETGEGFDPLSRKVSFYVGDKQPPSSTSLDDDPWILAPLTSHRNGVQEESLIEISCDNGSKKFDFNSGTSCCCTTKDSHMRSYCDESLHDSKSGYHFLSDCESAFSSRI